jgi:hypothetical protein
MVAQATQDAVCAAERALAVLHGQWDGLFASIEIVRKHGGDTRPLLDESDRIAALVRAETVRHRVVLRRMAREVVATAEELLGQWWDSDEYGESVMSETTMRFLNGGEEIDY